MNTNSQFKVYRGPYILSVGIPIVIVAISTPSEKHRVLEHYILIYSHEKVVLKEAYTFYISEGIPDEIKGNEALLRSELDTAQAKLENWISENREDFIGKYFSPFEYVLSETDSSVFGHLYVFRNFHKEILDIAHYSHCNSLKESLGKLHLLPRASREEIPLSDD